MRADRVRDWMKKGAQPSVTVKKLLNRVEGKK
jgi:ribosomal protein S16